MGGAREKVGGDNTAEDEDAIPAIKSSHLNLDDIPMELLPTHQEKIMKQVCGKMIYSGTSDIGPSEIGTTSLQGHLLWHHTLVYCFMYLRDKDNLSARNKTISLKVSLVQRFLWIVSYILPTPLHLFRLRDS